MNEPSPTRCEVCGASPLERVMHPVAVHYKGSGFYSTDYGKGGKGAAKDAGAGKDSGGGEASSGASSGESSSGPASSESPKSPPAES